MSTLRHGRRDPERCASSALGPALLPPRLVGRGPAPPCSQHQGPYAATEREAARSRQQHAATAARLGGCRLRSHAARSRQPQQPTAAHQHARTCTTRCLSTPPPPPSPPAHFVSPPDPARVPAGLPPLASPDDPNCRARSESAAAARAALSAHLCPHTIPPRAAAAAATAARTRRSAPAAHRAEGQSGGPVLPRPDFTVLWLRVSHLTRHEPSYMPPIILHATNRLICHLCIICRWSTAKLQLSLHATNHVIGS